jgi:hypothetical protein
MSNDDRDHSIDDIDTPGEDEHESPSEILVRLASERGMVFFKDQYKVPHVLIPINGHKEILRVETGTFRRYLARLYYDSESKIIGSESVKNAIQILQAIAEHDGTTYPLSLRVAWHDGNIYYDMTNDKWQCVKISNDGWEIVDETHVPLFSRYNQTAQSEPDRYYEEDIFDMFLQLTNLKEEEDRILLSVYIVTLFIPDIPHIVLQIHGEKGSAKSTFQTLVKMLVDPAKPKLLTIYNDQKEFIQQLAHNYLAFYDNLKYTPRWLSDEVCKAVTGVGSTKRKLYSDDDDIVYEYRRCLGFNGINLGLTEPDILDRSIMIELQRIRKDNTKQETDIMAEFLKLKPKLLAYIFDTLVKATNIKKTIQLKDLPRMADSAIWGEAIARAMGYKELEFIRVYYGNIGEQNTEAIENSPLGQATIKWVNSWYKEEAPCSWQGTMSAGLEKLNIVADRENIDTSKSWPKAANSLSRALRPLLSNLREGPGINITITRNTTGDRKVRGRNILRVSIISSPSSLPSTDQNHTQNEIKISEDIPRDEDTYLHQDPISSPKYPANHTPKSKGEGNEDSEGVCDTEVVPEGSQSQGNIYSFKCYYPGCEFQTDSEQEYQKHGALKHPDNPLLYPSRYEIGKYGLKPQGKEWEI